MTNSANDEGTDIDWLTALMMEHGCELIFEMAERGFKALPSSED